ncbi:MAG: amino acid ABC transporter ATP-binding protein [Blastochloris sp.]|nr:amino acid ABC transporter ATP-binding protein [Blastochloris sp.]
MKLELENVGKAFAGQKVLNHIHLHLESCSSLVLLGSSGCGKSTLLRLLSGLLPLDEGLIRVNGETLAHEEATLHAYRKKIGVVFQSSNLFPHLSARDNLLLPLLKVHHQAQAEAAQRVDELLDQFQLAQHAHKKPAQLSGGQRQRIAIARALAHRPGLLLLDEPTSALDPEMSAEVLLTIETLKQQGTDFILVTHQIPFARRVADRVLFLHQSSILESGSATEVLSRPQSPELQKFLSLHLDF